MTQESTHNSTDSNNFNENSQPSTTTASPSIELVAMSNSLNLPVNNNIFVSNLSSVVSPIQNLLSSSNGNSSSLSSFTISNLLNLTKPSVIDLSGDYENNQSLSENLTENIENIESFNEKPSGNLNLSEKPQILSQHLPEIIISSENSVNLIQKPQIGHNFNENHAEKPQINQNFGEISTDTSQWPSEIEILNQISMQKPTDSETSNQQPQEFSSLNEISENSTQKPQTHHNGSEFVSENHQLNTNFNGNHQISLNETDFPQMNHNLSENPSQLSSISHELTLTTTNPSFHAQIGDFLTSTTENLHENNQTSHTNANYNEIVSNFTSSSPNYSTLTAISSTIYAKPTRTKRTRRTTTTKVKSTTNRDELESKETSSASWLFINEVTTIKNNENLIDFENKQNSSEFHNKIDGFSCGESNKFILIKLRQINKFN